MRRKYKIKKWRNLRKKDKELTYLENKGGKFNYLMRKSLHREELTSDQIRKFRKINEDKSNLNFERTNISLKMHCEKI